MASEAVTTTVVGQQQKAPSKTCGVVACTPVATAAPSRLAVEGSSIAGNPKRYVRRGEWAGEQNRNPIRFALSWWRSVEQEGRAGQGPGSGKASHECAHQCSTYSFVPWLFFLTREEE